ncbi:MAG: hypothetical protein NVSMB6_04250 [Burkholderiaceae bacterium]
MPAAHIAGAGRIEIWTAVRAWGRCGGGQVCSGRNDSYVQRVSVGFTPTRPPTGGARSPGDHLLSGETFAR